MTTRFWISGLTLASGIALCTATPAVAAGGAGGTVAQTEKKPAKAAQHAKKHAWKNEKQVREHLAKHIKFPATKADLLKACNDYSDSSPEDKKWVMENLPEGSYASPDDVLKALGMPVATAPATP